MLTPLRHLFRPRVTPSWPALPPDVLVGLGSPAAVAAAIASLDADDLVLARAAVDAVSAAAALDPAAWSGAVDGLHRQLRAEHWKTWWDEVVVRPGVDHLRPRTAAGAEDIAGRVRDLSTEAARAVALLRDPRSVPVLIDALFDPHALAIPYAAARALTWFDDPAAVDALTRRGPVRSPAGTWVAFGRAEEGPCPA